MVDPDRLAELEEERRFLLRSLDDLEREYEAGDVDEHDYRELKDGYTARAAATMRAIDDGRAALPAKPPVDWRRRIVAAVVVVALVAVVWWALAASSAQRLPGQQISGNDPRDERQVLLAEARSLEATDPAGAAAIYGTLLEDEPDDPELLTYRGWTLALSATDEPGVRTAIDSLLRAADLDPTYPDPHCFLGIFYANRLGQPALALPELDDCLRLRPPADMTGAVQALRDRVAAEADGDAGTSSESPTSSP